MQISLLVLTGDDGLKTSSTEILTLNEIQVFDKKLDIVIKFKGNCSVNPHDHYPELRNLAKKIF